MRPSFPLLFFFNDTATTEIYTLSLHDALPIYFESHCLRGAVDHQSIFHGSIRQEAGRIEGWQRSEEHTSELQSPCNLVCRLLLEKKKNQRQFIDTLSNVMKAQTITTVISHAVI